MRGPAPRPLAARFEAKVDRSGGPEACHPWTGARTRRRYGATVYEYGNIRDDCAPGGGRGKVLLAHRVALTLHTGEPAPPEMDACHRCDNTLCCNGTHLFWGTHRYNMLDYAKKYGKLGVTKVPPEVRPRAIDWDGPEELSEEAPF